MDKKKVPPKTLHNHTLSKKAIGGIFFDEKKKERRSVSTIHQVLNLNLLVFKHNFRSIKFVDNVKLYISQ